MIDKGLDCCGNCINFKWESFYGVGYCEILKKNTSCSDICKVNWEKLERTEK